MKGHSKNTRVPLLNILGALAVLLALCFQIIVGPNLTNSNNLVDLDSITYVLEKDALTEFGGVEKVEFIQFFIYRTKSVTSVALNLNKDLTNAFGRASTPHSNRSRYILFRNPKLHCTV